MARSIPRSQTEPNILATNELMISPRGGLVSSGTRDSINLFLYINY